MTRAELTALTRGLVGPLKAYIAEQLAAVEKRFAGGGKSDVIADIEKRLLTLEARPTLEYKGAWAPGTFFEGNVVTKDGSMWVCRRVTTAMPGLNTPESRAWTLCVKRGRDSR